MKYCVKCVMPDTRPGSQFDEFGVCLACRNHEKRVNVDWGSRWKELEQLCDQYRRTDYYDCVIAVSGGKDSHFLVYTLKEKLHMNPLLVRIGDPFTLAKVARQNIQNLSDTFKCDLIEFNLNIDLYRKLTRYTFEKYGNLAFVDPMIYSLPVEIADKYGIKLVIFGEDPYLEYGSSDVKVKANDHVIKSNSIFNQLLSEINEPARKLDIGVTNCVFLGHYVPWSSYENYQLAKTKGFKELDDEWIRSYTFENWCQFDMGFGWSINEWLKAIKLGYGRSSDIASRLIREGRMKRDEGIELVEKFDFNLDKKSLDDFLRFSEIDCSSFYKFSDNFYNKSLWCKVDGEWKKKFKIC